MYGADGNPITLTGNNFSYAISVLFNKIPASFTVINNTILIANVPAGNATGNIEVVTTYGTTKSVSTFTKYETPVITSISPMTNYREGTITLRGRNFYLGNTVQLNGGLSSTNTTPVSAGGILFAIWLDEFILVGKDYNLSYTPNQQDRKKNKVDILYMDILLLSNFNRPPTVSIILSDSNYIAINKLIRITRHQHVLNLIYKLHVRTEIHPPKQRLIFPAFFILR